MRVTLELIDRFKRKFDRESSSSGSLANLSPDQQTRILDHIFSLTSSSFYLLDPDGRIQRASASARLLTGHESSEITGRPFTQLLTNETSGGIARKLAEVHRTGQSVLGLLATARGKNGRMTQMTLKISPLYEDGSFTGSLVSVEGSSNSNLQTRSSGEFVEWFTATLEQTSDIVIITDRSGKIDYVNPAFQKVSGYSNEEVVGKTPSILKSGKHSSDFYRRLWQTILRGETFQHLIANRGKNGRIYWEEQTIIPIKNSRGEISNFVSTGRDVTARKELEREREGVVALSAALRKTKTRSEMLPVIARTIQELLQVDACAIVRPSPTLSGIAVERAAGDWAEIPESEVNVLGTISNKVIETRCPYFSPDIRKDPEFARKSGIGGLTAVAGVPLIAQEQAIAVVWIGRSLLISQRELQMLVTLAEPVADALHRSSLHEQTEFQLQRLTALHAIDRTITSGADLRLSLEILLGHVLTQLNVDAASILLLNPDTYEMDFTAGRGFRSKEVNALQLRVGDGFVGRAVVERRVVQVPRIEANQQSMVRTPPLSGENFMSYFVAPLIVKDRVEGVLEVFNRSPVVPDNEWTAFFEALATQAAIAIDNATMFDDLKRSHSELGQAYDATIEGWAKALELRDAETEGHAQRVTEATLHLARAAGVPEYKMVHVRRGAMLHDIGKLGIPDSILYKPGPLDDDEWEIMRQHPVYARKVLSHVEYLHPALDIPFCHHEKWDGTGYPQGLKGEEIPREARIFAIIDVWDALRSDRPYRTAWDDTKAQDYIVSMKEKHFDPEIVDVFCNEIESFRRDPSSTE
jgi:PAS domain S-box-containing protein